MKYRIQKYNYIIYPLILILGLILGSLFFNLRSDDAGMEGEHTHETVEQVWTCSMHPQIRQNEPGKCPICGMDLIPVSQGAGGETPQLLVMTEASVRLADIQTTEVQQNVPIQELNLTGKIRVDETQMQQVVAQFPGRIEQLLVNFTGEQIRRGQPVARIYSPELLTAQRELIEAEKLREISPALYEAARSKLQLWRLTDAQINQIVQRGNVQSEVTIYSSATGVVVDRQVTVGDYVMQGQPLLSVADLSRVWVEFDAYESDLAFINTSDRISFTVPSMPGEKFSAKISFIDPVIDPQTRTAAVRAQVPNPQGKLKPEMFARGSIESNLSPSGDALVIPKSAVMWTGRRSVVYVRVPGTETPSFEYREIVLGSQVGDHYIVEEGLERGEAVVFNGTFTVDAAAQLQNKASMMNRHITVKGKDVAKPQATFDFKGETPAAFKKQFSKALNTYIELKDALVASDPKQTQQHATQLLNNLKLVNMNLVKGKAHEVWMSYLEVLNTEAKKISKVEDIEQQRKFFIRLSSHIIYTAQTFGTNEEYFIQRCPMANDNQGAEWLSKEQVIRNPFFGEKMLDCGDVIGKIE